MLRNHVSNFSAMFFFLVIIKVSLTVGQNVEDRLAKGAYLGNFKTSEEHAIGQNVQDVIQRFPAAPKKVVASCLKLAEARRAVQLMPTDEVRQRLLKIAEQDLGSWPTTGVPVTEADCDEINRETIQTLTTACRGLSRITHLIKKNKAVIREGEKYINQEFFERLFKELKDIVKDKQDQVLKYAPGTVVACKDIAALRI